MTKVKVKYEIVSLALHVPWFNIVDKHLHKGYLFHYNNKSTKINNLYGKEIYIISMDNIYQKICKYIYQVAGIMCNAYCILDRKGVTNESFVVHK